MQSEQGSPGGFDQLGELLVGGLLALVEPLQVDHELHRDSFVSRARHVPRSDSGEEFAGLSGQEVPLRTTWDELHEQLVQLAGHPGVVSPILRPCPGAKTRIRADSLAGTSTTASSRARRCWAT